MIKVHYCPSCGCFEPCRGVCHHVLQVVQCADCSRRGMPRNGGAYLAAVDGKWAQ